MTSLAYVEQPIVWIQHTDGLGLPPMSWNGKITRLDQDYGVEVVVNHSFIWAHTNNLRHPHHAEYRLIYTTDGWSWVIPVEGAKP